MRSDFEKWIHEPVPALKNRFVAAVFESGETGEKELREYLDKVAGNLGIRASEDSD